LFVLGMLARNGPMHGHQIRRAAEVDRTELWSDVKVGALYGVLHRMAAEGVVEVVRTEQAGNRPARTVYAITARGRDEFRALRDAALREARVRPDPFDLALQYVPDMPVAEAEAAIAERCRGIDADLAAWRDLKGEALPYISPLEAMTFDHILMRLEAERAWHADLLGRLPSLLKAGGLQVQEEASTREENDDG
jgi:DNA-binding PadR family transcriptional regulator